MSQSLSKLQELLGYEFGDITLLERALTHRSWAYENSDFTEGVSRELQNERLEFVGDSVLGLIVAEQLYAQNPDLSEGDLTLMKHHLVSSETLAEVAKKLDLGSFLRVGKGEEKTGGRRKQAILADTLEAIIAAIFFDSDYNGARDFVADLLADNLDRATPSDSQDFKTMLQESLQAQKRNVPEYKVVKTDGPPHRRRFTVEAIWDEGIAVGTGNSIKAAEMEAASVALKELESKSRKQSQRV